MDKNPPFPSSQLFSLNSMKKTSSPHTLLHAKENRIARKKHSKPKINQLCLHLIKCVFEQKKNCVVPRERVE
jgi:hypothetical protein